MRGGNGDEDEERHEGDRPEDGRDDPAAVARTLEIIKSTVQEKQLSEIQSAYLDWWHLCDAVDVVVRGHDVCAAAVASFSAAPHDVSGGSALQHGHHDHGLEDGADLEGDLVGLAPGPRVRKRVFHAQGELEEEQTVVEEVHDEEGNQEEVD